MSPLIPTMAEHSKARIEREQAHPENRLAGCVSYTQTKYFDDDRRGNSRGPVEITQYYRKGQMAMVAQQWGDGPVEYVEPSGQPNTQVGKSTRPFLKSSLRPSAGTPNQTVVEQWVEVGAKKHGVPPGKDIDAADPQTAQLQRQVDWLVRKVAEQEAAAPAPAPVVEVAPVQPAPTASTRKRRRR